MTVFQLVFCPLLFGVTAWQFCRLFYADVSRRLTLFRVVIGLMATIAVTYPRLVDQVAWAFGIARGADYVLYVLVFTFMATTWWFYAEVQRLRCDLTELIRKQAITSAHQAALKPNENGPYDAAKPTNG